MGRGPCLEARKKSSEYGTRRDQRSEWEKRWKNFPSQEGENSQRQRYASEGGREGISQIIALKCWPLDHTLLFDGNVFLEGNPS